MSGRRGRSAGFSLIEVMVVMAIIAALMSGGYIMLRQATAKRLSTVAKTRLTNLASALEQLSSPDKIGAYPRTDTEALMGPGKSGASVGRTLGPNNGVNVGIETVYVAVRLKGVNVTVEGFEEEGALGNLDNDQAAGVVPDLAKPDLYEFLDPYGNPYVYFHSADYKDPKKVERYVRGDGTEVKAKPKSKSNGEFVNPTKFQLFSMGPDGEPNTDDDIDHP